MIVVGLVVVVLFDYVDSVVGTRPFHRGHIPTGRAHRRHPCARRDPVMWQGGDDLENAADNLHRSNRSTVR